VTTLIANSNWNWDTFAPAAWMVYPGLPVFLARRALRNVKKVTVDRLCYLGVDGVYPFDVAAKNLLRRLSRPFNSLCQSLIATSPIQRHVEFNRHRDTAAELAVEFQGFGQRSSAANRLRYRVRGFNNQRAWVDHCGQNCPAMRASKHNSVVHLRSDKYGSGVSRLECSHGSFALGAYGFHFNAMYTASSSAEQ
jgi:hypothetical protein